MERSHGCWTALVLLAVVGCGGDSKSPGQAAASGGVSGAGTDSGGAGTESGGTTDTAGSPSTGGVALGGVSATTGGTAPGGVTSTTGGVASTGGSGGGGNGNGGGLSDCDGGITGLAGCTAVPAVAELVPTEILVVLDKSGSMSQGGLGSNQTKWQSVSGALRSALPLLAPYVSFGLELFPAADVPLTCAADCCRVGTAPDVAIGTGTTTVPEILALLDSYRSPAIGPGGNTPTASALALAYRYFQSRPITGKDVVLLVTDGGPNCNAGLSCALDACTVNLDHAADPTYQPTIINWCDGDPSHDGPTACLDDAATVGEIQTLHSLGVDTVVIGIPGSDPYRTVLDSMAVAGGQPNPNGPQHYYEVTSGPDQLAQILIQTITEAITPCTLALAEPVPDPTRVNLAIDCALVTPVDGSGSPQWSIDTSTATEIILQGTLCDRAKTVGFGQVQVLLGCPVVT